MLNESGRRLWHYNTTKVERKRGILPLAALAPYIGTTALLGGGAALAFGRKKKSRDVADPLAGLRAQLQQLASGIPAQMQRQKEITAGRIGEVRTRGMQGIAENIRAERGFGSTSLQDRLNIELAEKLERAQAESDLASDIWGTRQQADILSGTADLYPQQTEIEEQPSWVTNLLGVGANMAVQNWMQENQWKNLAEALGGGGTTGREGKILPGFRESLIEPASKFGTQYLKF